MRTRPRAFSSAGSEHLPYKQRVGGSNPSTPTSYKSNHDLHGCFFYFPDQHKNHYSLTIFKRRLTQQKKGCTETIVLMQPFCDQGGIQTHDLQNRNLTLYSAKLPSQRQRKSIYNLAVKQMNWQKKITFDILKASQ